MILRVDEEIVHHLGSFRVLHMDMLFLADRLHEVLVHELPDLAPSLAIVHDQKMVPVRDQVGHERGRPVAVDVAFLIQQALDELSIRDHDGGVREPLQTEDPTEFPRPFRQPGRIDEYPQKSRLRPRS